MNVRRRTADKKTAASPTEDIEVAGRRQSPSSVTLPLVRSAGAVRRNSAACVRRTKKTDRRRWFATIPTRDSYVRPSCYPFTHDAANELIPNSSSGDVNIGGSIRKRPLSHHRTCSVCTLYRSLSFGYRLTRGGVREPGACNDYLATLALAVSNGRPVVAQIEIDQAIRSLRGGVGADYVIRSARDPDRYLDTHDFAVQVRSIMDHCGWTTAALVAHPHHLPRVQAVFASLRIETATPGGVRAIWNRRSSQWWTRGPLVWTIRELSALWLYQRRGWLSVPVTREAAPAPRVRPDRARERR